MTTLVPGDTVRTPLGKGVVQEVRQHRRLLVLIGNRSVVVDAGDAIRDGSHGKAARRSEKAGDAAPHDDDRSPRRPAADVDLHGLIVADALERVVSAVDAAIRAGHGRLRVIHGRSGGRLRGALHRQLRELPSIRAFRLAPGNDGVTIIEL
ncbi:MAG: Smr/MutS family protein [Vicinamibacteraceae bacterium]